MESKFKHVHLFHGKGGSPDGSVLKIKSFLSLGFPDVHFHRPFLPHANPEVSAEESLDWVQNHYDPFIVPGSLVVGISLGGLIAAKLQETFWDLDLSVISVVSPTSSGEVVLTERVEERVALYSTAADPVIKGRCENWPDLTPNAFDLPWLMHDVDISKHLVCHLIGCYMRGEDLRPQVAKMFAPASPEDYTQEYKDDVV